MSQQTSTPILTPTAQTLAPRRDTPGAVFGAVLASIAGGYLGAKLCWSINPETAQTVLSPSHHVVAGFKTIIDTIGAGYDGYAHTYLDALRAATWATWWRVCGMWSSAAISGIATFSYLNRPADPQRHVRGRQLRRGAAAIAAAKAVSKEKSAISGAEILMHPSLTLARHQVFQSLMFMASQGGGKTQVLWRVLNALGEKNYKRVVYDLTKGDYTKSLPVLNRMFALGDKRSSVWAVWRDIKTLPDAESFARGIVPESGKDPMWSNAARGVLIAILMKLINERGTSWRWKDLGELAYASLEELKEVAAEHYPPALSAVADAESKTSQSIVINLHAFLGPLYRCYLEWAGAKETFSSGKLRGFSWIEWLDDDDHPDRTIVLQANAKDKTAASALIRAMMELQTSHIASLEFSESKTRNICYCLDELPQAGRLECLTTLLEVARSKGVALILAFQDIAQIRQIYPPGEDDKWTAMLGVRVFGQVKGGVSQKFVLDQIGTREVDRPQNSVSMSAGGYTTSNSYQRTEEQVILPAELELLGPQKDGVRAIVLGHGMDVLELDWPYFSPGDFRPVKIPSRQKRESLDAAIVATVDSQLAAEVAGIEWKDAPDTHVSDTEWTEIEQLEADVFTVPINDDEPPKTEYSDEMIDGAANHAIEHAAADVGGDVLGHGVGAALEVLESLEQGGSADVEQQIIPKRSKQKGLKHLRGEHER